jgi:hypothetical protein
MVRGKDDIKMEVSSGKDNIKMVRGKDTIKKMLTGVSSGKDVVLQGWTKKSMCFDSIESFFRKVGYY